MKYTLYLFIYLTLTGTSTVFSQNGLVKTGARAAGIGYSTITINDSWSLFNNPAGIGTLKGVGSVFAFENKYQVEGMNTMAAGVYCQIPTGALALSVFKFGDHLYNEQTASLTYGSRFGIASLGTRVNYLQYQFDGLGSKRVFIVDFGGIAQLTEFLFFGAMIRNINQAKIAEIEDERMPTLLRAGLSFRPTKKVMLNIEAEKDIDFTASLHAGLEYIILSKLAARTGVSTQPFTNYFGLGFNTLRLKVDYALTRHQLLGFSHMAAIAYTIKRE